MAAGLARPLALQGDLFQVLGAGRLARLRHLDGPASVPFLLDGLRLAILGAFVGAIVGEWFEARRGLGVVMLQTMRSGDTEMLLAAAIVAAVISLTAYYAVALVQRSIQWDLS